MYDVLTGTLSAHVRPPPEKEITHKRTLDLITNNHLYHMNYFISMSSLFWKPVMIFTFKHLCIR